MKEKIMILRILALLLFLSSCKAYRNVENLAPKVSKEAKAGPFQKSEFGKLVPGDKIVVESIKGFKYYLIYQSYDDKNLVGSQWKLEREKLESPEKLEIPLKEIAQIYVRRVSAQATVPVVLLSALGILFGIYAIAVSADGGYW